MIVSIPYICPLFTFMCLCLFGPPSDMDRSAIWDFLVTFTCTFFCLSQGSVMTPNNHICLFQFLFYIGTCKCVLFWGESVETRFRHNKQTGSYYHTLSSTWITITLWYSLSGSKLYSEILHNFENKSHDKDQVMSMSTDLWIVSESTRWISSLLIREKANAY